MNKRILFVDDERAILNSIRRELFDSQYELYFSESAAEALKLLENIPVSMVVVDMKMPGMNGYELLKEIKLKYPFTTRVILSGYTDEKIVFKSIYNNLAKLYLGKPWKTDEFRKMIDGVFKTEALLKNEKILNSIKSMNKLPTINLLYEKISKLIEDENYDIDLVISFIEKDMVLSSQILKVVNSAFYGLKTSSIKTAVLNLGLVNLKTIVLTSEILDYNDKFLKKDKLWQHVNLTNKIMSIIYRVLLNKKFPEYYYTAGLLHDIGKIVFLKNYSNKYDELYNRIYENEAMDICSLERKCLNANHEEIGGYMLQWWNIPYPIVEAALYHHEPMNPNVINKELVAVTHIADYYSWMLINNKYVPRVDNNVFDYLNLTEKDCKEIIIETLSKEGNHGEI